MADFEPNSTHHDLRSYGNKAIGIVADRHGQIDPRVLEWLISIHRLVRWSTDIRTCSGWIRIHYLGWLILGPQTLREIMGACHVIYFGLRLSNGLWSLTNSPPSGRRDNRLN